MENEIIALLSPILNDIQYFLFPNEFCTIINSVIFFLLFLTLLLSRSTIRRYKQSEKEALVRIRQKVDGKLSRQELAIEPGEADDKEDKNENSTGEKKKREKLYDILKYLNELREGVNKKSIIYKRVHTIERMLRFGAKIDADFLQQNALTSEAKRLGTTLPGFSTKFALILGLLGTFIGLALMVTKINMLLPNTSIHTFSISSIQSSIAGMGTVFQGIKTAFSTSIVGIFTTLVCLYLSFRIYRSQTAYFHELETFTVQELIPATVPVVLGEHPLEKISFQLQDSFDDIELIISQNKDTIENLGTIQSSFKTIVDEVREITKGEASRSFVGVLTLLTKTNESLSPIVEQISIAVEAMKKHSERTDDKINSLIKVMENQQKVFDREMNRFMKVREEGFIFIFPSFNKYYAIAFVAIVFLTILLVL